VHGVARGGVERRRRLVQQNDLGGPEEAAVRRSSRGRACRGTR
jgi:hypothetical protein